MGVYLQNRLINTPTSTSNLNPVSHTFVFTVMNGGTLGDTYSWGNAANIRGWTKNDPEDIAAAKESIRTRQDQRIKGGPGLIPFLEEAYKMKAKADYEHNNLGLIDNCKAESEHLLQRADDLSKGKP